MKKNSKLSKLKNRAKNNPLKALLVVILTLFVGLSLLQAERLINQGTFFGYRVRDTSKSSAQKKENQARSGSLSTDMTKLPDGSNNEACKLITLEDIKEVRPVDFKQSGGLTPDTKDPLLSTCVYSFKGEDGQFEMITVLLRGKKDDAEASKVVSSLKQQGSGEDINGVGDEAYFNKSANQLTIRKGSQVITITVSSSDKGLDTRSTATKLGKNL